jgi:hypothetical protein
MNIPEITASQALDILEETFKKEPYRITALRIALKQLEAAPIMERFIELYDQGWWGFGELQLKCSMDFPDRTAAMKWMVDHGHDAPEFSKHSYCDGEGSPRTQCILSTEGQFEGIPSRIEACYSRSGMSTTKCRVVPKTSYCVVCDI